MKKLLTILAILAFSFPAYAAVDTIDENETVAQWRSKINTNFGNIEIYEFDSSDTYLQDNLVSFEGAIYRANVTIDPGEGDPDTNANWVDITSSASTYSLDAPDGDPTDAVSVDNDGDTTVSGDLTVNGSLNVPATDGNRKITVENNASISPTASEMGIYPEANEWRLNENGTEKELIETNDRFKIFEPVDDCDTLSGMATGDVCIEY